MKIIDMIFCDDIRYEINNKLSLMGIYNDRLILRVTNPDEAKWPLPVNLATLFRFKLDKNEQYPDHFEFEYILNDKNIVKFNGAFVPNPNSQNLFTLALIGTGIPLEPGNLGYLIKLHEGTKCLFTKSKANAMEIVKG